VLARGVGGSPFANRDLAMRPVTNQGQILLPLTADDGCVESALTGPYPTLRVVGLEPADPPRREAIAKIETADYSDRIEIRDQPVEALTDVEGSTWSTCRRYSSPRMHLPSQLRPCCKIPPASR
jgi:hypothetical protein